MRPMKQALLLIALTCSLLASAQNPTSPQIVLVQIDSNPTGLIGIYHCGDHRLFLVQQNTGIISIIDTLGANIGTFLNICTLISTGSERGLLGLAFHPDYLNNGRFFINYTNTAGSTVVAEYHVSADPNVANAASAQILLTVGQPFSNHNGGHIAFGPDGYLYIGMGDGGSGGDPGNRAQNPLDLLGKMLRIDVNNGSPYGIPADNPFVGNPAYAPEIWATGLRNPWKFSFDRETGDMWIADVGQNAWEEINFEPGEHPGGSNWGWRCYEGNVAYNSTGCAGMGTYDFPVAVYSHSAPDNFCSVTGGYVYRGNKFPGLYGHYMLMDYCAGDFYSLFPDGNGGFTEYSLITTTISGLPAFGEDSSGELYVARYNGVVYRLEDACGSVFPEVSSNGNGALTCDTGTTIWWWKDGVLIPGATGSSYTPTTSGVYYATAETSAGCIRQSSSITWLVTGGIPGCTYPEAINYNPEAETDDGSCDFGIAGCTYPDALNYNPAATRDDGSCDYGAEGCTYPAALNFNTNAVRDDGSCTFLNISTCPADLNSDGVVNVPDLSTFIGLWGVQCD